MADNEYDLLMVDPPWPKRKGGLRAVRPMQDRDLAYRTMTVPQIFDLLDDAVFPLAAPTHNVFLWAIDEFLWPGEEQMKLRGYHLHARMVWDKGNGVAPAFTVRYSHEYLLWFYRPKLARVNADARGKYTTVFAERGRQHSRKPDAAYNLVEDLYPDATRLDVFSREARQGWGQWGDETSYFGTAGG